MRFDSLEYLKNCGFEGFKPIGSLMSTKGREAIPRERGVYLVLYLGNGRPSFLEVGTGGGFRQPPNENIKKLKKQWVDDTLVVYIGQAGCKSNYEWSDSNLRERLSKYMRYGGGKRVAHEGGRNIWQIEHCEDLVVCWKALPNRIQNTKEVEGRLIEEFKNYYGQWPFANHQD